MTEAVDAQGAAGGATEGAKVLHAVGRCPEERVDVARGGRAGPNDLPSVVDRPRVRGRTAQGAEIGNRVARDRARSYVGAWARIHPRRRWFTAGEGTQQRTEDSLREERLGLHASPESGVLPSRRLHV